MTAPTAKAGGLLRIDTDARQSTNPLTAIGAFLRCPSRIDQNAGRSCILSFIGGHSDQLSPGSIRDALIEAAPVSNLHALNVQVLEDDDLKAVYQIVTQLVCEVMPVILALVMILVGWFWLIYEAEKGGK